MSNPVHVQELKKGTKLWNRWRDEHRDEAPDLTGAVLDGIKVPGANLRDANLNDAKLQRSVLVDADLRGATLVGSCLQGANFEAAIVDERTKVWTDFIDKETDFTGVALSNARVDPGTRQLLEYFARRRRWGKYYRLAPWWWFPFRWSAWRGFWSISDYGISTGRIVLIFAVVAFLFTAVYYCHPEFIEGLSGHKCTICLRAFYFSVVTMTTLGFGDMRADPNYWQGHVLVMGQVVCGYAILAALVTRLAVLFTAGGPPTKRAWKSLYTQ
jgi:hypothetical protein